MLIDIHGQHEHQSLLRPAAQRELLDAYAGATGLAREVAQAWREWQESRRRREESESNAQALAAEREQLQWQVQELSRLAFSAEEWDTLQADHRRLSHAASLQEAVEHALESLSEGEAAALAVVGAVVSRLNAAAEYDPKLKESLEVLEPAQIQIQEAVYGLRHYRSGIDLDPRRLQEVEQRLEAVHSTARKYRVSPERLPETLAELAERLALLGDGASAEELERRELAAAQAYRQVAQRLSQDACASRRGARAACDRADARPGHGRAGASRSRSRRSRRAARTASSEIELLAAANPGATVRPLAKVASGGELSRLSLAIQTVATEVAEVPTLVFDEVDAGIGGRVAEIVGRMLKQLGRSHQVMCITHLPQVAAAADRQWQVSKSEVAGKVRAA